MAIAIAIAIVIAIAIAIAVAIAITIALYCIVLYYCIVLFEYYRHCVKTSYYSKNEKVSDHRPRSQLRL